MPQLNIDTLRLGEPVEKPFRGQSVYIMPSLNSMKMIEKYSELAGADEAADNYGQFVAAVYVRHHVVDKQGEPLFAVTVDELLQEFDGLAIRELYDLVEAVAAPVTVGDAEKNS